MTLTLKQLRYFEAVAQTGHFGRAAALCAISQPAISVQIKELEAVVGAPLFERGGRQVILTSFGAEFSDRARDILRAVDDLEDLGRAAKDGLAGRLRIGIIPTIAPYLLPRIIGNLAVSHADLDIHVRETLTERLIEELNDGQLDAAIVALPVSERGLEEMPLFREDFVLVRSQKDGKNPVPDPASLKEMRLLLLEEGHCFRDQALAFCNMRSSLPREGMDGSSLSTLVQMVATGIGVTLVPEMAITIESKSAEVSISRFRGIQPSRTIGMVWRKSSPLVNGFESIADVVRKSGQELRAEQGLSDRAL